MKSFAGLFAGVTAMVLMTASTGAAATVVVTSAHPQGWVPGDVRAGGDIEFVNDPSSPLPSGALQLTTDDTNDAKAQYLHPENVPLASVTELGYATKQVSASFAGGDPSFQLVVDLNGAAEGGFTTFVFEPYQNGTVTPNVWEQWDVDAGNLWSSRSFSDGTCVVVAGAGGPPFYTLAGLQTACPNAVVLAIGVNVGTFNPNYVVETDGVTFNGTTYNFEAANEPADRDACKDGGWQNLTDADGNPFKNQGQCVSYASQSS